MRSRWQALAITAVLACPPLAPAAATETFGIPGATFPETGLMTAGQPTGEQIQILAEEGYRTVVDLRFPQDSHGFDEPAAARDNGLAYVNVPVNIQTLDPATVDRFLEALRKAKRPMILHARGTDEAGALYYAWLVLEQKVPAAKALEKARAVGLKQPALTRKIQELVAGRKP